MELLERHFDVAFSAPDGIKKLRELILTFAMHGKLVPQDPSEKSSSELLKTIQAERKQLVKERKLKTPKPLSEITASDEPYPLPQGWQWVRLGIVGNIFNGNSINTAEKESKYAGENGLPYIATKDVGYGLDPLNYKNGICIPLNEEKFRVAHKGAVLICAEGGSAGKKCGLTDRDICFGNKLFANELYGQIPARFILYTYLSPIFRAMFSNAMTGIIGGVSIAKFGEISIPLPPLEEQNRIVAKIDQLMSRCDALEELRKSRDKQRMVIHKAALSQLLDTAEKNGNVESAFSFIFNRFEDLYAVKENVMELRKSILHLALMGKLTERLKEDGPVSELLKKIKSERSRLNIRSATVKQIETNKSTLSLPDGWALLPLDAILILGPTNGYSPKAVDYKTKVKSLTLSATTSGVFKGEHSKFIVDEIPISSYLWLQDGDILVQRGNTIDYVGVPAIYRGERNTYIYPDLMMKLRVSTELDSDYVCFAMSAKPSRDFLRERASGTSGTMPKINQKTLSSLPIPIPPIEEQRRIVSKINKLMRQCDQLEEQIVATNLKQSELLNAVIARYK
ncbi:MAG TPA: restriction endonuclease subunit S [Methylophilus sp.]|uniref:restriction endonuclease subunit S n=1 Tax=Methylophilus sp. TaxID=29541 RepID=UPI002CA404FE|nr:restriction endonuclease subunit S [Methylophilus sp.]HSH86992.1 restriction endonuclease subunit S [Methylophilus sp.]